MKDHVGEQLLGHPHWGQRSTDCWHARLVALKILYCQNANIPHTDFLCGDLMSEIHQKDHEDCQILFLPKIIYFYCTFLENPDFVLIVLRGNVSFHNRANRDAKSSKQDKGRAHYLYWHLILLNQAVFFIHVMHIRYQPSFEPTPCSFKSNMDDIVKFHICILSQNKTLSVITHCECCLSVWLGINILWFY